MRSPRRARVALLLWPLVAAGCSGGSGPHPSSSAEPTSSSATSTAVASTTTDAPTTSATPSSILPSAQGTVPIDQIPPGHPLQWVPAGVPTKAKYKELGDVVPKFNRIMFENSAAGAISTVQYFLQALNWDSAVPHTTRAYEIVCTTSVCEQFAEESHRESRLGLHVSGYRIRATSAFNITPAPVGSHANWVVQVELTTAPGSQISASGRVVLKAQQSSFKDALFLSWSGKRWIITDDRQVEK